MFNLTFPDSFRIFVMRQKYSAVVGSNPTYSTNLSTWGSSYMRLKWQLDIIGERRFLMKFPFALDAF